MRHYVSDLCRSTRATTALCLGVGALLFGPPSLGSELQDADRRAALAALTEFHQSVQDGDADRHFGMLAPDAVLFGTASDEQWTAESYRAWLSPYLPAAAGRMSMPVEQHVTLSDDGTVAWFHERLDKPGFAELRATGVMTKVDGRWKIAQYHVAFPLPNEIAVEVAERMRR